MRKPGTVVQWSPPRELPTWKGSAWSTRLSRSIVLGRCWCAGIAREVEPLAKKNGGDPHCLMVSETGFDPYTSLLFVDRKVMKQNASVVEKMVRASIRGWKKYLADPKKTNELIHKLNPEMDMDVLQYGAEELKN